jgi:carboxyl-terminal processing protease
MSRLSGIAKVGMPLIIAISVILGMYIQRNIDQRKYAAQSATGNKLDAVLEYIDKEYVDTVNVSEIVETTIPLILEDLDPHSVYIPAADLQAMNEPLEGNFDGIGVSRTIRKSWNT